VLKNGHCVGDGDDSGDGALADELTLLSYNTGLDTTRSPLRRGASPQYWTP
jgi:hypothetical protein